MVRGETSSAAARDNKAANMEVRDAIREAKKGNTDKDEMKSVVAASWHD